VANLSAFRWQQLLPFLSWRHRVNRASLRQDATAGLISAVFVLPQGVAFAILAGLPPEYGLYCAMVPTAVAALFGSSWHTVSGPTNTLSLFVFATLGAMALPGSPQFVSLALTLAFMCGVMMIALGLMRMGALVNFISQDVITGFTAGAGVLIIASQLPNFFGVALPRAGFAETVSGFAGHLGDIKPWVLAVSIATLAAAVLARRHIKRLPYMLTAIFAGGIIAWVINRAVGAELTGIRTLGPLPGALPPLSHPEFSLETMRNLSGTAVALTVISLTQAVSIARAVAVRSGQRIDGNQEFIGQGLANIAASFFSGFPTSGSINRSGPNLEAGAQTPLAAVFAAGFLVLVLLAFGWLVAWLPLAAMAAVLFLVAWGLVDWPRIRLAWTASRGSSAVIAVTFFGTLFMDIEFAVLAGVGTSLVLYLHRTSHPTLRSLVPDPHHPERKMAEVCGDLQECPQMKLLRIEGSIYFGAVDHVGTYLEALRTHRPGQKHLLLMSKSINTLDLAGAELLAREARIRLDAGGALYMYSPRKPVVELLERGGQGRDIGAARMFASKDEAIAGVFAQLDRDICARCHARIFTECKTLPPPI
jgi:SulP family sulfate permease